MSVAAPYAVSDGEFRREEKERSMDANRFDNVVRLLTTFPTRRAMFGLALSGLFGAANRWDTAAKKKGHRKKKCKKCGPCRICKKGKCKGNKPDGTECGTPCMICQGGQCVVNTGEPCGEGQVCLSNGSCAKACTTTDDCAEQCFCSNGLSEQQVCFDGTAACFNRPTCEVDASCPIGTSCLADFLCEDVGACLPLCPD